MMKIRDLGDGTVEITETVAEINARAVAQGLPPPIVVIEQPTWGELGIKTRMTKAEFALRSPNPPAIVVEVHGIPEGAWMDISSAPMDGTHILLWNEDDGMHEGWWDTVEWGEGWYNFFCNSDSWTHWRPLLLPPQIPLLTRRRNWER